MKQRRSAGEMISSVTFFGFGFWLFSEAMVSTNIWQIIGLVICGIANIAAAFRFSLARLWRTIEGYFRP